jgi:hypothetical protein
MIDGEGDPGTAPAYREAIEALYAVAYTVKFAAKRVPDGIDFMVMPLEGLWWSLDPNAFRTGDKREWRWTAMIMQPDPVSEELVAEAVGTAASRKSLPALERLRYERFTEGTAAQVMYLGSYSEEGPTIVGLHAFIAEQGYVLSGKHHEIYLGDPRRTAPERLKTVLRQPVALIRHVCY